MTGVYEVGAHIGWDVNSSGFRSVSMRRSGTGDFLAREAITASAATGIPYQNVTTVERLTAGDYVEVLVHQSSGGNRSFSAELSMTWLAPGP